jgi:RimJ/RimL family protein N-acetyltransferase
VVSPDWPLETDRLTLRPFVEADLEAMHAIRSDPDVARYLYREPFQTLDETRGFLEQRMATPGWEREGDWLSVAAVERESGLTVGDLALHWVSARDQTAEVGFVFDPRHQGKGFATEAARALVDWAFSAGFHRVIGRTEARNAASARVLEKLGMRLEAHFVENEWVKGEWQSELVFAILDREWGAA